MLKFQGLQAACHLGLELVHAAGYTGPGDTHPEHTSHLLAPVGTEGCSSQVYGNLKVGNTSWSGSGMAEKVKF